MRKISIVLVLLFSILIVVPVTSKATIGEESTQIIRNPDRGFYKLVQRELQKGKEDINDFEEEIEKISQRDEDVSLISFQLNLKKYVQDTNISNSKIEEINQYFSIMRNYGYQVIFRVVYDSEGEKNPEPDFTTILRQMEQLKPIYQKNEDIIIVIEAGYLGSYGEWHDGKYDKDKEKRNQIIDKLLEIVPQNIQINLRKPSFIQDSIGDMQTITEKNAFTSQKIARLGLHNDGYLASESDLGTYNKKERDTSLSWQEKQTQYTLFGGECQNKNSTYTDLNNAIIDMQKRHCTYLNKTYDTEVKEKWKATRYQGDNTLYQGKNGYEYIQNHLGYRLVLREATIKDTSVNDKTDINIQIENVGFGNIIRKKQITIIYQNNKNSYEIKSDIDIRKQKEGNFYQISFQEQLPSNMQTGEYQVYLKIREPYETLKDNQNYGIKLANENSWNKQLGANYIGTTTINSTQETTSSSSQSSNMGIKVLICIVVIIVIGSIIYVISKK